MKIIFVKRGFGGYKKNRERALILVRGKIEHFNKFYGLSFSKVTIRNQKSRWGSCSRRGNLSFNYKIVFLPQRLADYLVVHELCHLKEFNHSKNFWSLVSQTIPNWQALKKELRLTSISRSLN